MVLSEGERPPVSLVCALLLFWVVPAAGVRISARVGDSVQLKCGADESVGSQEEVSWSQLFNNRSRRLVSMRMGEVGPSRDRMILVHNSALHLVIQNLTLHDSGEYNCIDANGNRSTTLLNVSDHRLRQRFLDPHRVGRELLPDGRSGWRGGRAPAHPQPPLSQDVQGAVSLLVGETVWMSCATGSRPPYSWQHRTAPPLDRQHSQLFDRVMLHPGCGLSLGESPSLLLLRIRHRNAGTYVCRARRKDFRVELSIQGTEFLSFLAKWWIILVTAALSLCVYTIFLAFSLAVRRRQQRAVYQMRITRLISSFFRRNNIEDSLQESRDVCSHRRNSSRAASGSTWYENLPSIDSTRGITPLDQTPAGTWAGDEAGATSYENLFTEEEGDSQDYMDPSTEALETVEVHADFSEGDVGGIRGVEDFYARSRRREAESSVGSGKGRSRRDYIDPNSDPGPPDTIEVLTDSSEGDIGRIQGVEDFYARPWRREAESSVGSGKDYIDPNSDPGPPDTIEVLTDSSEDTEVYEQMARMEDDCEDQHSNSSGEDYENMESSEYCDVVAATSMEMSEEEFLRMERCRLLFLHKFNTSNSSKLADIVVAMRNPR